MIFWTTLVLAVAYILLAPRVNLWLYHRCLFKPAKERGDRAMFADLVRKRHGREYRFTNRNNKRLHAWLLSDTATAAQASHVLLYSMGKDGDIDRRAQVLSVLLDTGLPIFIYEYAGYGESEGLPSLAGICSDAVDAFDFVVRNLGFDEKQIVLYGESLGSVVSAQVLTQRTPGGIILKSAFSSLERIAKELVLPMRVYPTWLFPIPRMDTCAVLHQSHVPVLIVHGSGDRLARKHHAASLFEAANEPSKLIWLPDSRHAFTPPQDEITLRDGVRDFVCSLVESTDTRVALAPAAT